MSYHEKLVRVEKSLLKVIQFMSSWLTLLQEYGHGRKQSGILSQYIIREQKPNGPNCDKYTEYFRIFQQHVAYFNEALFKNSLLTPKPLRFFRESVVIYMHYDWRDISCYDVAPVKQLTLYGFSASL